MPVVAVTTALSESIYLLNLEKLPTPISAHFAATWNGFPATVLRALYCRAPQYAQGTFVPVAQAVINSTLDLLPQPTYGDQYDIDRDPVWQHKRTATPVNTFAWYQCDQLGTPMEISDENGQIVWTGIYDAWGLVKLPDGAGKPQRAKARNPLRFQGQYFDTETLLHYNRHRYYDPWTGRFISKDPIGYSGGLNLYFFAPNTIQWLDPLGLARIKNSVEGDRRHKTVNERLRNQYPDATIQCECYLRDSAGNSVFDTTDTNTRRRIDTVVIEDGKAQTHEVTSLTAKKVAQAAKERMIIENGGTFIRDRTTKDLVPITGPSIIIREP